MMVALINQDYYIPESQRVAIFQAKVTTGIGTPSDPPKTSGEIIPYLDDSYNLFKNKYDKLTNPQTIEPPPENSAKNAFKILGTFLACLVTPIGATAVLSHKVICPAGKESLAASKQADNAHTALPILSATQFYGLEEGSEARIEGISKVAFKKIAESYSEITNREKLCKNVSLLSKSLITIAAVLVIHAVIAIVVFHAIAGSTAIFNSKPLLGLFVISAFSCSGPVWIAISTIGGVGLTIAIALRCYDKHKKASDLRNVTDGLVRFKQLQLINAYPKNSGLWERINNEADLKEAIAKQQEAIADQQPSGVQDEKRPEDDFKDF